MKVLMIGMDGASVETFQRGWTPYISKLFSEGKDLGLKTDLYSRGWLEIATGEHSSTTSAMYDRPKCDGTHDWRESFKISDIPGFGDGVKPIWQRLNERGHRVGIMNLPTSFPAPKVDGFFVSGGGGGGKVVRYPTPELCFPQSILPDLLDGGYIVDERIAQLVIENKLTDPSDIFDRLAHKNAMRTNAFINLSKKFAIDFGFVIYKTSSVLAEGFVQVDWHKQLMSDMSVDMDLLEAIKKYYKRFDAEVEKLHKAFPNAEIMFVADHGMTRRTHSVNPNRFLNSHGYQCDNRVSTIVIGAMSLLKKALPFWIKKTLKRNKGIDQFTANTVGFDSADTLAFCRTFGDWRYGIYINDVKRFGGPVSPADIQDIANRIVCQFNEDPIVVEHGMRAMISSSSQVNRATESGWFPDIVIDVPDGYLITDRTQNFVEAYKVPSNYSALGSVLKGDIASIKSTTPVTFNCGKSRSKVGSSNSQLLDIYKIVDSKFA